MRKTRYHDMMRYDVSEFVRLSACPTLDDMISTVREREIELEHTEKRKADLGKIVGVSVKKPKGFDYRSKVQQCRSHYGRSHDGVCRAGGSCCYKCGKSGHFRKDCSATITTTHKSNLICFH